MLGGLEVSALFWGDVGIVMFYFTPSFKPKTQPSHIISFPQRRPPPPIPPEEEDNSEEIVVAMYDFQATEAHDLRLERGQEYIILEKNDVHWWKARDKYG